MPGEPAPALPRSTVTRCLVPDIYCASCVAKVEKSLISLPGVASARVNFLTKTAEVVHDPSAVGREAVLARLDAIGYPGTLLAEPGTESASDQPPPSAAAVSLSPADIYADEFSTNRRRFLLAAAGTVPVMVLSMTPQFPPSLAHPLMLALTAGVMAGGGNVFFIRGWKALRRGSADMNTLIALGTGAAFVYSVIATFFPGLVPSGSGHPPVYFETAAMILTLVLLGNTLESRSKARAAQVITRLMELNPRHATVVRAGCDVEVDVADLQVGDLLRVKAGEIVPTDGVVVEGESAVDEALLTGEPMPVDKAPGDRVFGGTLNRAGSFLMCAERVGSDTALAGIVKLVSDAQSAKAPIQRLADRLSAVFVPTVAATAGLAFLGWAVLMDHGGFLMGLNAFIAVLIIACPCAMGLATPTAILVGTGAAAARGVVFKSGEVLENTAKVQIMLLDKTGTITLGTPRLVGLAPQPGWTEDSLLALAGAVEQGSDHPLAKALVEACRKRGLELPPAQDFREQPGKGAVADVEGKKVTVGKPEWVFNRGPESAVEPLNAQLETLVRAHPGATAVAIAVDGNLAGWALAADPPRPTAAQAVSALKALGITPVLLTGDRREVARYVADVVGIDEVVAEVSPGGKVQEVHRRRTAQASAGRTKSTRVWVGLAGDGLNDAPALVAADVGFAVGSGSDVAREAGGVVLVGSDPVGIAAAVRIARRTVRVIKQNLFWALFYNCLGIPLAAGLFYPFTGWLLTPPFAAAAMALSSVSVVSNSLRLRKAA